jgi:hypothetical protein
MLERTGAITNEVLEPITLVLVYPTVRVKLVEYSDECNTMEQSPPSESNRKDI